MTTGAEPAAVHGTLTLPTGAVSAPGVLILAGSGPVNRNGNLPGLPNDSLKLLAHALGDGGSTRRSSWRGVRVPVLIIQGTTDLQVSVADARRLAHERPDAELVFVDGMNHVLRQAPADRAANLATYADPGLPLSPGLITPTAAFLNRW